MIQRRTKKQFCARSRGCVSISQWLIISTSILEVSSIDIRINNLHHCHTTTRNAGIHKVTIHSVKLWLVFNIDDGLQYFSINNDIKNISQCHMRTQERRYLHMFCTVHAVVELLNNGWKINIEVGTEIFNIFGDGKNIKHCSMTAENARMYMPNLQCVQCLLSYLTTMENLHFDFGIEIINMNVGIQEWPLCSMKEGVGLIVIVLLYCVFSDWFIMPEKKMYMQVVKSKLIMTICTTTYAIDPTAYAIDHIVLPSEEKEKHNVPVLKAFCWQNISKWMDAILLIWKTYESFTCLQSTASNSGTVGPVDKRCMFRTLHATCHCRRRSDERETRVWQMVDIVIYKCISVQIEIMAIPVSSFEDSNDTRKDAGMEIR